MCRCGCVGESGREKGGTETQVGGKSVVIKESATVTSIFPAIWSPGGVGHGDASGTLGIIVTESV